MNHDYETSHWADDPWAGVPHWGRTGEVPPPGSYETFTSPGPAPWATTGGGMPPRRQGVPAFVWVILGLIVTFLLCAGAVVANLPAVPAPTSTSSVSISPETEPTLTGGGPFKTGQQFQAGDFRYTVHAVKTGVTEVGDEFTRYEAQGEFTRIDLTVFNSSTQPQMFDADWFIRVKDGAGREFSADSSANIFGNETADSWLTEINPGNSVRAYVYFDLPEGTDAEELAVAADLFHFDADAIVTLR